MLSFPAAEADTPEGETKPLGDIVLAAGRVAAEAAEQEKPLDAHIAHLVVHGTLHLLGYDHMKECEASIMEGAEAAILHVLGYPDPYQL